MQTPTTDDARATKLRKLETSESIAILQGTVLGERPSDVHATDPLAMSVGIKRGRLVLFSAVTIVLVVVLTFAFSGCGVVIDSFDRRARTIQEQERLLEKYNSYSGSITAALERPIEVFMALVVQVIVLRVMAHDVLQVDKRWRVTVAVLSLGAVATYLLANSLSAVNVQVRELPVKLRIRIDDLATPAPDLNATTTLAQSFPENQAKNPAANTILRNFFVPRVIESQRICSDRSPMQGEDDVVYRIPQHSWMKDLVPVARGAKSVEIMVSKTNAVANTQLTPDQLPMNASIAADLLVYSLEDPMPGSAWNHREWFLQHSGPRMYNVSGATYKNASLRSWTMTFSHVDIEPGVLWVDAVTVEREMASPRLVTTHGTSDSMRYYEPRYSLDAPEALYHKFIPDAGDAVGERIDLYTTLPDANDCVRQPLDDVALVITCGHRLVADTIVPNATVNGSQIVAGGNGVIVNMREVFSVTIARIAWQLQNLSATYNAECDADGGCMGLDAELPGSRQRVVVSANAIPLAMVPSIAEPGVVSHFPRTIVSVRRPQTFTEFDSKNSTDRPDFIGAILMPHNIRNTSTVAFPPPNRSECIVTIMDRMATVVNNHYYMEHTLQPTYTAAALFVLQSGVVRDVITQSWTPQRMLAFNGNTQRVDVYVYIPWLNVTLTFAGCLLLATAIVVVVFWSHVGLRKGESDPLTNITTHHTIANVLFNESAFPPLLLTRSIAPADAKADNGSAFMIRSLSLVRKTEQTDAVAA